MKEEKKDMEKVKAEENLQVELTNFDLEDGIISVNSAFDNALSEKVISLIDYLVYKKKKKDILIKINSPGGVITDGLAIYDKINSVRSVCRVHTAVTGMAASMGAALLCMGDIGLRYAFEHSTIMIHQPLSGYYHGAKINDLRKSIQHTQKIEKQMTELLAGRSKISVDEMRTQCDRDNYMSAEEALKIGLIDKIITAYPDEIRSVEKQ